MRNLKGNTHLSPISLYTKSTFLGLLLNRIILPLTRLCNKFTTYHFVHLVRDFACVEMCKKPFLEYGFSRVRDYCSS